MKMRRIAGFIISMLLLTSSFGQGKLPVKRFSLPQQATSADYENGVLLAKLKPAFRNLASSTSSNGRTASLPDVTIKSLTNPGLVKQNYSARGPFASNESKIDMSLYVKLFVGPGTDIEKKINELYATGYFEIIEPNYSAKIDFEPNDPSSTPALQYYLVLIRAYDAWDISKSDASTVIAIVDSGGDLDHPDLAPNLYTNPDEIPNNNIDDDGDGYKDNVTAGILLVQTPRMFSIQISLEIIIHNSCSPVTMERLVMVCGWLGVLPLQPIMELGSPVWALRQNYYSPNIRLIISG